MSNDNAIAPAFAIPTIVNANGDVQPGANGLTKREYFAAMAMQGWLAGCNNAYYEFTGKKPDVMAESCVKFADALLAELAKPTVG